MCRLNDVRYSNLTNSFEFKLNVERGILTRIYSNLTQLKTKIVSRILITERIIGRERSKIEVGNSLTGQAE